MAGAHPSEQACDDSPYHRRCRPDPGRDCHDPPSHPEPPYAGGRAARPRGAPTSRPGFRPGHVGAALRPGGVPPLRRARGGAAAGGDRGAGGQAAPPRAGLVRPSGPAHAGRAAGRARPAGRPGARRRRRRHPAGRAQPHRPTVLPAGFRNDSNDSRILVCRAEPRRRGPRGHPGHQGHAAAGEGRRGGPARRRVPRTDSRAIRLDRDGRARRWPRTRSTRCTPASRSTSTARRAALPHRPGAALRRRFGARPGARRTSRSGWSAASARRSACTAGRPSSGSRWTCCWTTRIGIVSLGGRAGTGKSALALCAGLEAVMERRAAQEGGGLPPAVRRRRPGARLPAGQRESEKMSPWAQAVFDTLGAVVHENVLEEVTARGMLEVLPLTHIRGRSACTTPSSSSTRRSRWSGACC